MTLQNNKQWGIFRRINLHFQHRKPSLNGIYQVGKLNQILINTSDQDCLAACAYYIENNTNKL